MSQIYDLPGESTFGLEFDYEQWTPDTRITLTSVPWSNTYESVFYPDTREEFDDFLHEQVTTNTRITAASYARINEPVKLSIPINKAMGYNYLRVENPLQPGEEGGKRVFYYFILSAIHHSPNCTEFVVELDFMATFIFDITPGRAFVESGHLPFAAENRFDNYGRRYLDVPEGLDTGSEMVIRNDVGVPQSGNDVVIYSTLSLTTAPFEDDGKKTPKITSAANGYSVQGVPTGAEVYIVDQGNLPALMLGMSNYAYVSRGIYNAVIIPSMKDFIAPFDPGYKPVPRVSLPRPHQGQLWPPAEMRTPPRLPRGERKVTVTENFREVLRSKLPAEIRHVDKLLTTPYFMLEVTDWNGNPVVWNPEKIVSDDLNVTQVLSIVPGSERIATIPDNYGSSVYPEGLPAALISSGLPTISMVNDGANIALASNFNQRAVARSGADWAYQKNMMGAQNAYDNAGIGIDLGLEQAAIGRGADTASTGVSNSLAQDKMFTNGVAGIVTGAGMGAVAGGAAGAAMGAVAGGIGMGMSAMNTTMDVNASNQQLAIRNASSRKSSDASARASNSIRKNNQNMANIAAKGDYQMTIASLNAQVQDTRLTPPQVSGMQGGNAFPITMALPKQAIRFKTPPRGDLMRIAAHFMRYGYKLHRYQTPPNNFHVMTHFSYWKMADTHIFGNIPEVYRQSIRGVLEKGVTFWRDARDIGRVDLTENRPLPGVILTEV